MIQKKGLFLDRDGVINYDLGYIDSIKKYFFKKNIFKDLKKFQKKNFFFVMITNQSGIAKKKFSLSKYLIIEKFILNEFNKKGFKIKIFYCPHHKNAKISKFKKNCYYRKPNPGMILKASKLYNINLKKSILIGDKISDIKAGLRAGIKKNYLVKNIKLKKNKNFKRYESLNEIYKMNFK
tara:strand:- start:228 stop:767 length:540 start_codon:yes stop_codon:yes gene_type:complete